MGWTNGCTGEHKGICERGKVSGKEKVKKMKKKMKEKTKKKMRKRRSPVSVTLTSAPLP